MDKIESFKIDHTTLLPGIYVSRIDGDITTYDLRFKKPNTGDLLGNSALHSLEHMLATILRNSAIREDVIYFGPMGCQTGFYLLIRNAENDRVLHEVCLALQKTIDHTGEVFGKSEAECGNYINLSIDEAKREARAYLEIINSREQNFKYI